MPNSLHRKRLMDIIARKHLPSAHVALETPPPPNVIPESMLGDFTLQGIMPVLYLYFDERTKDNSQTHNTPETYKNLFSSLDERSFIYYGPEGQAFFDAFAAYPVEKKTGTIWGLLGCNCEAFSVWANAEKVFVVDYNKPICEHEKIIVYTHEEFVAHSVKTDFAISYSSFEHDGLGRYGDPLSPDGDMRAMKEAWDSLNDDGILFLGLPLGQDCLVWNAHRIYGKARLPMMLRGWQLLDVFSVYHANTPDFPFDSALGEYRMQSLMVLKKIPADWPDDDYLLQLKEHKEPSTHSAAIFNRINKMVYAEKHGLHHDES